MDIVVNKEKLSKGQPVYVAHCTTLGISSQGKNAQEAIKNIQEAIDLYLEEQPEKLQELLDARRSSQVEEMNSGQVKL